MASAGEATLVNSTTESAVTLIINDNPVNLITNQTSAAFLAIVGFLLSLTFWQFLTKNDCSEQ